MSFLGPAYNALVNTRRHERERIEAQVRDMAAPIMDQINRDPDKLIVLDILSSTLSGSAIHALARLEAQYNKDVTVQECEQHVLLLRMLQLFKVIMQPTSEDKPFCCTAHLSQHVARELLDLDDSQRGETDAILFLSDWMCEKIMQERDPKNYHMLDAVLDKLAKRQRRRCYKLAYGKEEGEKLAIEHELGLKAQG